MSKPLKISIGLAISLLCLWLAFRGFNFALLKDEILKAKLIWFVPAVFIFIFDMWLRSVRWKLLLSPIKKVSLRDVFPALVLGFFMNNILPARAGEFIRTGVLSKETDIPVGSVLGSVIVERLTDFFGFFLVLFLSARLLPWNTLPVRPLIAILAAGLVFIFGLFIYVKKVSVSGSKHSVLFNKIFSFVARVTEGFRALQSPAKVITVLVYASIVWMCELMVTFFISRAMSVNLNFLESAALLTGLSFGVMIPAAPGFIGTYEFFGKTTLTLLGKSVDTGLPFIIVLHFFGIFSMAILAFIVWLSKTLLPEKSPIATSMVIP